MAAPSAPFDQQNSSHRCHCTSQSLPSSVSWTFLRRPCLCRLEERYYASAVVFERYLFPKQYPGLRGLLVWYALPKLCISFVLYRLLNYTTVNVYSPQGATNLPVMVWIHGGGYGLGDGTQNLTNIINANGGGFVGVAFQYRVSIFYPDRLDSVQYTD